jgi:hypothetical protein
MQTSKSKRLKLAAGRLLAQKQKAPQRTARSRKKSRLFSAAQHQQHVPRLPHALRAHPKKQRQKLLLKLVLQQHSQQAPALLVLQQHSQLLAAQLVKRQHSQLQRVLLNQQQYGQLPPALFVLQQNSRLQRTLLDPQQHGRPVPALLVPQRKQRLMVRGQVRPNERNRDSAVQQQLRRHYARPALLPCNARLLLVARLPDPVPGQPALHPARFDRVDTALATGDVLQAQRFADSLSAAFQ